MNAEDQKAIPKQQLTILLEELLILNRISDCVKIVLDMANLNRIPHYSVLKKIMKEISSLGDVDMALNMGRNLPNRVKISIKYYDSVCETYVAAGRSHEYLDILESMIDNIQNYELKYINTTFPVNGILHLLEKSPQLENKFIKINEKYVANGSVVPCNALWIFNVITKQYSKADELWNKYLSSSPTVKYHKICRAAKLNCDFDIVKYVLEKFQNSASPKSDKQVLYETALDILLSKNMKIEAIKFYNEFLTIAPDIKFSESIVTRLQNDTKELEEPLKDWR